MLAASRSPITLPGAAPVDHPDAARLWLPRLSLSQCVRAVIARDTTVLPPERLKGYNYYPCAPTCAITWFMQGHAVEVMPGEEGIDKGPLCPKAAPIIFSGPYTRPVVGWYPEPIRALLLVLMPDAVQAIFGIDPGAFINQTLPIGQVLPTAWQTWCHALFDLPDDAARVSVIERTLNGQWQKVRPDTAGLHSHLLSDWYAGLSLRAVNSGLGRSARQVERRIKQWTGLPLRELRGFTRSEQAFFQALESMMDGTVRWADVAAETGYADQSHMCRQSRRLTGFAPEELRRRIIEEEGFWLYRLWGLSLAGSASKTGGGQ